MWAALFILLICIVTDTDGTQDTTALTFLNLDFSTAQHISEENVDRGVAEVYSHEVASRYTDAVACVKTLAAETRAQCNAFGAVRASRTHPRFGRALDARTVLRSLLSEYCALTPKMANSSLPPALFVDVGSHSSEQLQYALDHGCRVVSVQPSSVTAARLEAAVPQMVVKRVAVAHTDGEAPFRGLGEEGDGFRGGGGAVELKTLDALFLSEPLLPQQATFLLSKLKTK